MTDRGNVIELTEKVRLLAALRSVAQRLTVDEILTLIQTAARMRDEPQTDAPSDQRAAT